MEKIKLKQAILVEGKYDKTKIESIIDGLIIPVHGFSVFTDEPLKKLILQLAMHRGVIIMMDSDGAGFKIRGFLHGIIPENQRTDIYIPDIFGKERRKNVPSKEGKLGVEGIDVKILKESLISLAEGQEQNDNPKKLITQMDFIKHELIGADNSGERRKALYMRLDIPERISTKNAIKLLNTMISREDFMKILEDIT